MMPGIAGIAGFVGETNLDGDGATPAFQAHGAPDDGSDATVVVPYPAGILENDIVLLHVVHRPPLGTAAISTPAGFTSISNTTMNGIANSRHAICWKRCTGSESGTVAVSVSGGSSGSNSIIGIMSLWRGCKTSGNPYEGLATSNGSDGTMESPAVITTGANRRILHFLGHGGAETETPAVGYTEEYSETTLLGTVDASIHLVTKERASAGTELSATHAGSGSPNWNIAAFALLPTI
jgi:hypothetical protein